MFIAKVILFLWILYTAALISLMVYRLKINRDEKWLATRQWRNNPIYFLGMAVIYPIFVVPYWISRIHVALAVTMHNALRVMLGDMNWWDLKYSLKQLWWDTKWLP